MYDKTARKATLLSNRAQQTLIDHDGELALISHYLDVADASVVYRTLLNEIDWQEESVFLYGRSLKVPRLVAWYGEPGACYKYSGVTHQPLKWTVTLQRLRRQIERDTEQRFNCVLANYYRDGNDSMGWHGDNERELGPEPDIASLSLGAERIFKMRHNRTRETLDLNLADGDLLLMGGELQQCWQHSLPKRRRVTEGRINLTFRWIG